MLGIIEIGSNNTKTHIYDGNDLVYENTSTIEFKKNYNEKNKIKEEDIELLYDVIDKDLSYTNNIHIYGCSIFRNISKEELDEINTVIKEKYNVEIEVVSQEDEAYYTALGCYAGIDYKDNICVFIGGGGSIELIFVNNKEVIDKKYYNFGVVDVTSEFPSLKDDIPTCTFDEVYNYVDNLSYIKKDEVLKKPGIILHIDGDGDYAEKCKINYKINFLITFTIFICFFYYFCKW